MNIMANNKSVYITDTDDGLDATAVADNRGDFWWIGRILVQPATHQGMGHGGRLLDALIDAVHSQGGTVIHVTPGGYDADPDRQRAFYLAHGFVVSDTSEYLLIHRV